MSTNFAGKSLVNDQSVTMTFADGNPATAAYRILATGLPPTEVEKFNATQIIAVGPVQPFNLASSAHVDGAAIPLKHACTALGGSNTAPALAWLRAPAGTASFAIVMDDEVSPCGVGDQACIHWNVFNLPATVAGLAQGANPLTLGASVVLGTAYNGAAGYQGLCPPSPHTYKTTVYALDATLSLSKPALTRSQFAKTYASHILGSATLTGTFAP